MLFPILSVKYPINTHLHTTTYPIYKYFHKIFMHVLSIRQSTLKTNKKKTSEFLLIPMSFTPKYLPI